MANCGRESGIVTCLWEGDVMDQITTHATASKMGSAAEVPAAPEDTIDFLQPNSDFEAALRSTKDSESRFWLF